MSFSAIIGALSGLMTFVNKVMDFITAERLKQAGINEQRLKNETALNEVQKAADDARKNPPDGNIIDHL